MEAIGFMGKGDGLTGRKTQTKKGIEIGKTTQLEVQQGAQSDSRKVKTMEVHRDHCMNSGSRQNKSVHGGPTQRLIG